MGLEKRCPCCNVYKEDIEFKRLLQLENAGLVIYRYITTANSEASVSQLEKASHTNYNIFIIHNTKNRNVSTSNYMSEVEQAINCPRCRYIMKYSKELLLNVPFIKKRDVIGICDHCRFKKQINERCNKCQSVVEEFLKKHTHTHIHQDDIRHDGMRQDDIRHDGIRHDGIRHDGIRQDDIRQDDIRQDDIRQDDIRQDDIRQDDIRQDDIRQDDIRQDDIRQNDIRQDDIRQDDIRQDDIRQDDIRQDDIRQDDIRQDDIRQDDIRHDGIRQDYIRHDGIRQDDVDLEVGKSSQKEEEIFLRGILKQSRSVHNIRHYPSEETLLKSTSARTEPKLRKDFSYVFIKETDVNLKPSRQRISSSELIKDTQDMYRERAEKERIKKEKELKEKLDAEERVRHGPKTGRKRRLEEEKGLEELKKKKAKDELGKKKAEDEHWKTKAEEELGKINSEEELRKKKAEKELIKKNAEKELKKKKEQEGQELNKNQLSKQVTKSPKKSENTKIKTELKESKIDKSLKSSEEKQRQKEEKKRERANKAEQMRKDKEEKRKEKEEKQEGSDQKQREKEERLKAKEERLKEKETRQNEENKNVSKKSKEIPKKKQLEQQMGDQLKDKASKLGKKQEEEAKKQEAQLISKSLNETKAEVQPEKPRSKKITEESKKKDFNVDEVKIRKNSGDDLILQLVKFKKRQGNVKEPRSRIPQNNILNKALYEHIDHKNKTTDNGIIGLDSDLEFNIENIHLNETKPEEIDDIIIGTKISKFKPSLVTKKEDKEIKDLFFNSTHAEGDNNIIKTQEVKENIAKENQTKTPIVSAKYVQQEVPKGIIRYALSDRTFIEKGWTMLPTEKVVRKMNVYRMRPAHPEFDWFEHNKSKKLICYDTGEKLAEFDDNGKGRWYYRSGKVALDYYDAEEINAQQRIIIYSSGEPDERGCSRPFAILATFDYLGNGIVFDHSGKIRIKYNQTEGVVLDRAIGPASHWKWHTLNDPPVLQQVMIDTQMAHKDPEIRKLGRPQDDTPRPDNEEMLAIEFDNFIKEKSKKLSQKFKPFQIKMKALKINEYFSLKVLDQATIYLIYRDGSTNLKLNIGMILDHQEIVDTDTAEVGEVSNSLERFPARTDSLAGLQRSVAHAQRVERAWVERTQRLRPAQPCASADRLVAGLSRPKRPAPPEQGTCPCRKPCTFNVYYDTRLI